jgi:hypothetical protein
LAGGVHDDRAQPMLKPHFDQQGEAVVVHLDYRRRDRRLDHRLDGGTMTAAAAAGQAEMTSLAVPGKNQQLADGRWRATFANPFAAGT